MNIPSWVVSIRHEVTHSLMPPMFIMQEALFFCRNWLWVKLKFFCYLKKIFRKIIGKDNLTKLLKKFLRKIMNWKDLKSKDWVFKKFIIHFYHLQNGENMW